MNKQIQTRTNIIKKKKQPRNPQDVASVVHRVLRDNRELKYFDTNFSATNIGITQLFYNLAIVPQGPAQSQRVADEMWMEKVDVRMNITTANADIFTIVRWFLFAWRIPTATANPVTGNILNSTGQGVYSPTSHEYRSMYQIIGPDLMVNLTGVAAAPTVNSQFVYNGTMGLGGRHVQFTAGGTNANNLLFLTFLSNSSIAPFPVFAGTFRLWYYDEKA